MLGRFDGLRSSSILFLSDSRPHETPKAFHNHFGILRPRDRLSLTLQLWAIYNWSLPPFFFSLRNLLLHTATCCGFLSETKKPYG